MDPKMREPEYILLISHRDEQELIRALQKMCAEDFVKTNRFLTKIKFAVELNRTTGWFMAFIETDIKTRVALYDDLRLQSSQWLRKELKYE